MSKSRSKGTRGENAFVSYMNERGFVHVERRAMRGIHDTGDIAGVPGWVFEVKNQDRDQLAAWVNEMLIECANAGTKHGIVIHPRRSRPIGQWYATMTVEQFVDLLQELLER